MEAKHTPGPQSFLSLGDLRGLTQIEVKQHIAENYAGSVSGFDYGHPSDEEKAQLLANLQDFDILIAYESVGDYGCDSSSWFLVRDKQTGMLYENHGGHCSCYGFEGQWEPEETTFQHIASDNFYFSSGGYDNDKKENAVAVKEFARAAIAKAQPQEGGEE